jgi:ParB-like chromosome segregation protein Spo0J
MQDAIKIEIHEVATIYPNMSESELRGLADDIYENGLREKIWTYCGQVIDGRHRLKACEMVGVEPQFQEWEGSGDPEELVSFVRSKNAHRRHYEVGQRAMIAAREKMFLSKNIAEELPAKISEIRKKDKQNEDVTKLSNPQSAKPRRNSRKEAAKKLNVSQGYVSDAERIIEASPEVAEEVKQGKKTIPQAKRELGLTPPKPKGQCRLNGVLVDDPPDIAKLREEGKIPAKAIVDIEPTDEATTLEEVTQDYEERAAMGEEALADKEWLDTLPARKSLSDARLATFDDDALLYRKLETHRRAFASKSHKLIRRSKYSGAYRWKALSFLKVDHPRTWTVCPKVESGGCGGEGLLPTAAKCPKCYSQGYRISG